MKLIGLLFILTFLTLKINAAKEYSIKLKVYSLGTKEIIQNASVTYKSGKSDAIIIAGNTNEFGEILIEHLKDKYITLYILDETDNHTPLSQYFYNPDKLNQEKVVYLRWTEEKEKIEFDKIDSIYNQDALINKEISTDSSSITNAEPLGGMAEFQKFLIKNLIYPSVSLELGNQGKVYVSFIIEKDGAISNVKIVKGVDEDIDKEAIKLIRYSPKWKPAKQNEKSIRVKVTLPINFTLN